MKRFLIAFAKNILVILCLMMAVAIVTLVFTFCMMNFPLITIGILVLGMIALYTCTEMY